MLLAASEVFWANYRIKHLSIFSKNPKFLKEKLKIKMSDQLLKSFKNIKKEQFGKNYQISCFIILFLGARENDRSWKIYNWDQESCWYLGKENR